MQFYASPAAEAVSMRRAAARAGCLARGVKLGAARIGQPQRVSGVFECRDGWGGGRLLLALALEDARTPGAAELAAELRAGKDDEAFARAIHAYVRAHVRFERERVEEFESGSYTLEIGVGDCDAHFRLIAAVAAAGGLRVGLALLHRGGGSSPSHAVAVVELAGEWRWVETTVAAKFGEPPNEAARRLGLTTARSDIAKEVTIMTEKDLAPVPPGYRERANPAQVRLDAIALQRLGFLCADAPSSLMVDPTETTLRVAVRGFQEAHSLKPDALLGPVTRLTIGHALEDSGITDVQYPGIGALVPKASAHVSDDFLLDLIAMVNRYREQGATAAPSDFAKVWVYESGINSHQQTRAINPTTGKPYDNAGINQMGEQERQATGFRAGLEQWLALDNREQLPFVDGFYKGAIRDFAHGDFSAYRDAGSVYVATFAPAHIAHSGEPDFPLYDAIRNPRQYQANRNLDHGNKGRITVDDMRIALGQAGQSALFREVEERLRDLGAAPAAAPSSSSSAGKVVGVLALVGIAGAVAAHVKGWI